QARSYGGYVSRPSSCAFPTRRSSDLISASGHRLDVPYERHPAPALNSRCTVGGLFTGTITRTQAPSFALNWQRILPKSSDLGKVSQVQTNQAQSPTTPFHVVILEGYA